MKRGALAFAAAIMVALAALAQSCASVIGVDDANDAVAAMCQCNERLKFLGKRAQCEALIAQRVDGASEETRQAWLEKFADEKCDECANVLECYYQKPACNVGDCTDSKECCGFEDGTGYCLQGLCRRKEKGCKHTFQACTSAEECCGSEGGLAECNVFGFCVEDCSFNDAANCPTCCMFADTKLPQMGQRQLCLDPEDKNCALLCDPAEPCASATAQCQPICDINDPDETICPYACLQ